MIPLLAKVSAHKFDDYRPGAVIQAVNALQPLGKERALEQIQDYLKQNAAKDNYGLFWVLRVLFDVPTGQAFPPVRIGQPDIPPPTDPGKLPRFPIVIIRDVPLLVVRGYFLGGMPESPDAHAAYFRTHGILRTHPLAPPTSTQGIESEFLQQWKSAYGDSYATEVKTTIKAQLARLD
jgi:hypothetical protein